jgi:NADH-quinone oxidoreductase subunit N
MISDLFLYRPQELAAETIIFLTFLVVLLMEAFAVKKATRQALPYVAVGGIMVAMLVLVFYQWPNTGGFEAEKMLIMDPLALLGKLIVLAGTGLVCFFSPAFLRGSSFNVGEYYVLILASCIGMLILTSVNDLLMIFLGLELMSIPLYVLIGLQRDSLFSGEASLKYLLLGAFTSGFLVFGIAVTYGITGSTNLTTIATHVGVASADKILIVLALTTLIVGIGFKVAAVPFHMWAPDVYQGAPITITAFMSVTVKVAAFIVLLRLFTFALAELQVYWQPILYTISALSMILGNLLALKQDNLKRMLAYSAIAHTGYILVGIVTGTDAGNTAVVYYLAAYSLLTFAAFGVLILLSGNGRECDQIDDLKGVAHSHPVLGIVMAVSMLGLIGIPPTAGFFAKFYIFSAAIDAGYIKLVVIGVIASAISLYFYLRILVYLYMQDPDTDAKTLTVSPSPAAVILLTLITIVVFYIGLAPSTSPWGLW